MRKILFIVEAVKWFDKINGNTYHSVQITRCKDNKQLYGPFTYGYGEQYKQTALDVMGANSWLPKKYQVKSPFGGTMNYLYERENKYPIKWILRTGTKKECITNGLEHSL